MIATENGWNLYVGGNGGFRPRHADLFASDLSTEELIRYIDRFLMFYIRTADRLQRTAGWIEALDGGLDYLRAVIVEDSLGPLRRAGRGDGPARRVLRGRVAGDSGGPGAAGALRVIRQRPGHPGPDDHLRSGTRPAGPGRSGAGRSAWTIDAGDRDDD